MQEPMKRTICLQKWQTPTKIIKNGTGYIIILMMQLKIAAIFMLPRWTTPTTHASQLLYLENRIFSKVSFSKQYEQIRQVDCYLHAKILNRIVNGCVKYIHNKLGVMNKQLTFHCSIQVSPRACHWLRVVENVLVWLSSMLIITWFYYHCDTPPGQTHIISMTNLILLFQNETQKTPGHRYTCIHVAITVYVAVHVFEYVHVKYIFFTFGFAFPCEPYHLECACVYVLYGV